MKKALLILTLTVATAHAFEPICNSPQSFAKKDIQTIFQEKENTTNNQLVIYSVNPPTPIDWSSPKSAFKSIFRNSFIKEGYNVEEYDYERGVTVTKKEKIKTHFIGHMFMQLSCAGYPSILTGMSSPGYEEIKGLMIDGKSFSQIISTTKGHFNTSQELQEELDIRRQKVGNLHYMGIKLKAGSCEELLKYLTEFRACGVNNRYGGLDANPHKGDGAGCSAFAISFLQRLNLVPMIDKIKSDDFGSEFLRTINIPKIMLKTEHADPKIGAWGLLKGSKVSWASGEDGRPTTFFDPELFSQWVKDFSPEKNNSSLAYIGRDNNKLVNGIWFDENSEKSSRNINLSEFSLDFLRN